MSAPDSDELLQAYRRASAAEAGAPPRALRDTILAEATAAARRRIPAANDSRFHWRAVAGVAVLGVAVLLWRQMDPRLSTTPREIVPAPTAAPAPAAAPSPAGAEGVSREMPAAEAAAPPANEPENRVRVADSTAPPAPPPPPPSMAQISRDDAARIEASRSDALARSAREFDSLASTEALSAMESSSAATLLRQHFPQQYASNNPPQALWLVQDETGNILHSGEANADDDLAAIARTIEPALAGRRLGPWRTDTVPNAHGLPITISVAQTR